MAARRSPSNESTAAPAQHAAILTTGMTTSTMSLMMSELMEVVKVASVRRLVHAHGHTHSAYDNADFNAMAAWTCSVMVCLMGW